MIKNSLNIYVAKAKPLVLFTPRPVTSDAFGKGRGNIFYSHNVYVVDLRLNIRLALATLCLVNNLKYK